MNELSVTYAMQVRVLPPFLAVPVTTKHSLHIVSWLWLAAIAPKRHIISLRTFEALPKMQIRTARKHVQRKCKGPVNVSNNNGKMELARAPPSHTSITERLLAATRKHVALCLDVPYSDGRLPAYR